MDILKIATDWAKAEVFSTAFFILFGIGIVGASIGFWQLGKTVLAKAYIIPLMVAGILLLIIGFGLFFNNISRISSFEAHYNKNAPAFLQSEFDRVDRTLKEYKNVFTVIPIIIAVCALVMLFMHTPVWRASLITTIAMMTILMLVDGTAYSRIEAYKKQLVSVEKQEGN